MLKICIVFIFLLSAATVAIYGLARLRLVNPASAPGQIESIVLPREQLSAPQNDVVPIGLPVRHLLDVPFTPQAPTANWDTLHNEACEEASAIMAAAYFSGDARQTLPPDDTEEQINFLTDWQQKHFGYYLNTTTVETARMISEAYGLKTEVVADFTESQLKQNISDGKLVIIPVNGRLLGNPYYKRPGPIYHMLVVRGYDKNKIITNDSGTKRGENYVYDFNIIKNAGVDWDHLKEDVDLSKKIMIVVYK